MFSKSKRFQAKTNCAPPVGSYDVSTSKQVAAVTFQKSERWTKLQKENQSEAADNKSCNSTSSSFSSNSKSVLLNVESSCKKTKPESRRTIHHQRRDLDSCRKSLEADVEFQQCKVNALLERIKGLESLLKDSKELTEDSKDTNEKLHNLLDTLRFEKSALQDKIKSLELLLTKLTADLKITNDDYSESKSNVESLTVKLSEMEGKFTEMELIHCEEKEKIEGKLLSSQNLNIDFREQLESVEWSMTDNLKGLTEKYECLEQTLDNVQSDYKNRLERSNSLVEKTKQAFSSCETDLKSMNQQYSTLKIDYDQLAEEKSLYEKQVNEKEIEMIQMKNCENSLKEEINCLGRNKKLLEDEMSKQIEALQKEFSDRLLHHTSALKDIEEERITWKREVQEHDEIIQNLKKVNNQLDQEIVNLTKINAGLSEQFENLKDEIFKRDVITKQKEEDHAETIKKLVENCEKVENDRDRLTKDFSILDDETRKNNVIHQQTEIENSVLKDKLQSVGEFHEKTIEKLNRHITTLQQTNSELIEKHQTALNEQKCVIDESKFKDLLDEMSMWKTKYEELERKVSPFMSQLDDFEIERQTLLNENAFTHKEMSKLSEKYAQVLGHQNNKQKIHHIRKLKEDNLKLQAEAMKLRASAAKDKVKINQLENRTTKKFDPSNAFKHEDKENVRKPLKPANC